MLHIKLKGMERRAPYKHICCPYISLQPTRWVFMLHKEMEHRVPCKHRFGPYTHTHAHTHTHTHTHLAYFHPNTHPLSQMGSKCFFLRIVMLHIILKGVVIIEHRAQCKLIFSPYAHLQRLGWGQRSTRVFFSVSSHIAYQIKGNGTKSSCKLILCP